MAPYLQGLFWLDGIWSGTVLCPACWCGGFNRWPWWFPWIGSHSASRTVDVLDICRVSPIPGL